MYAIRRKYMTLQRKTIPTGDPKCPAEVKQAKRIKYKLGQKADLGDAAESYSIENGFDEPESPMLLGQKTQEEDEEEEENNTDDDNDHDAEDPPPVVAASRSSGGRSSGRSSATTVKTRKVRPYNKSIKEELLETMQMNALQQQNNHKMMVESAAAFGKAIAQMFLGNRKKKKKKRKSKPNSKPSSVTEIQIDDSSSSSSSESESE